MAIDWGQQQLIPNDFLGGYADFTPDADGAVIASVQGQGDATQRELAWAYVGNLVVSMWISGGNFLYDYDSGSGDSYFANMEGNGTLPVRAGTTFTLGSFLADFNEADPYIYFWWVPDAPDADAGAGGQDQAALGERLRAQAEKTKPAALSSRRG